MITNTTVWIAGMLAGLEFVVDGTDALEGWYAWSPLAPRGHSPCHQQKQQTVTTAWAGWKRCCPIGNSGPIVHEPRTIMPMVAPWLLGCPGTAR